MTGMQMMAPTPGVVQQITFTAGSIDRVVVIPAGSLRTTPSSSNSATDLLREVP